MDFQTIIVGLIIFAAAFYVGRLVAAKVKSFSPEDGNCDANCGCESSRKKSQK